MKQIIFVFLFLVPILALGQEVGNYWQNLDDTIRIDTVGMAKSITWKIDNDTIILSDTIIIDTITTDSKSSSKTFRPELIIISGAGYNDARKYSQEDFGFLEGKLMFKIFNGLRLGPYLGYTRYSAKGYTPKSASLGKELKYGLSLDSYEFLSQTWSYYAWLSGGLKNVKDRYQENDYDSKTTSKVIFFSGGLSISDDIHGWFSHIQLMFDYHKPIGNPEIEASWKDKKIDDEKAYNKEAYRLVLESGLKRFYIGHRTDFEPLIHLGYGKNFGNNQNYYEVGGGIGFGFFKDWYRDILKIKAYWRTQEPGSRINFEAVLNITSLINIIK